MRALSIIVCIGLFGFLSCSEDSVNEPIGNPGSSEANLVIKFKFDPNQVRLNNLGQPATISDGNAAQSPNFARMSSNYIELAPTANTLLGEGAIVYEGPSTTIGGEKAIDFRESKFAGSNETFVTIPLRQVAAGNYSWVRVSLAYQEGAINFLAADGNEYSGTLASFVGYNTYVPDLTFNGVTFPVNANKLQGFWAFEALGFTSQGQAPPGATTVPNPLFDSSPIPQGSCVVTGEFENGLNITGNETEDVVVTLSFSVNNSFEWTEITADGKYEPQAGEQLVDMGLRGLIPMVD
ncbi:MULTISPECIES: hypothetical protein [Bizionia]|uniref:Lipoprotein n=1 Tax=Bizionia algoritergicola TaxID=291187 RepID=A0A5D0R028_9FLAO|nr:MULTISPECIES: hypothetical protein [Bizionia]OBX23598.1 hypothetical protein BAA08_04405 [Bizionia sp. APA-3]TYB74870.1 hypothetical protein ES675_01660 [Bizionia algoritergicola]